MNQTRPDRCQPVLDDGKRPAKAAPEMAETTTTTAARGANGRARPRFTAGAIRYLTIVIAVSFAVAGCRATSSPGQSAPRNSPPAPSTAPGRASGDPQPGAKAACYLLSRKQVESALGFPVKALVSNNTGDCIYDFSNKAGGINFGVDVSSPDRARADFNAAETSDEGVSGLALTHLKGIGQDAFLLVAKGQGTGVEVLSGSEVFVLQISWAEAPHKPAIAITLAREAIARLHTAG